MADLAQLRQRESLNIFQFHLANPPFDNPSFGSIFYSITKMAKARKSTSKSLAKSQAIKKIIARLEKAHPAAKLDLDFANPLELLVALILAAQARDDLVNQVTEQLFRTHKTAADYAQVAAGRT